MDTFDIHQEVKAKMEYWAGHLKLAAMFVFDCQCYLF